MLEIGTKAPGFSLADQDNANHSLADYAGKYVLLYFYPKDDTPGCTKEACAIADVYNDFNRLGLQVLGVSKDTPASHKKFAQKYNLPFALLSDTELEVAKAYDAWQEKSMYGKSFMGVSRISYLIDPEGRISRVYPKVDPASHALEILKDLKEM